MAHNLHLTNLMDGFAATPEAMQALGAQAAAAATPGSLFALVGGLGAGKTHWTKGFVAALGSTAEVTSPTFGLVHEYPIPGGSVKHLDFYRLNSPAELLAIGWDEMTESGAIIVAEWADKFPELLPPGTHWLELSIQPDQSRQVREIPSLTQ
jgi:tRNA threonylcarbamoyladenosine biosynthesis protein TsaE